MPCYDGREDEEGLLKDLDKVTRLLCEACRLLEGGRFEFDWSNASRELSDWNKEHKKLDRKRRKIK